LSSHYVNFGGQQINTTSDPAYITLTNSGTVELTISEISASDNFSVTDDCGDTLSSGSECTLSITFSPSSSTSYSGAVTIIDDTTDSPQSITLEGIGLSPGEPVVSLSISSMDFGEQTVETTSDAQVLTVTNMGSSDLEISSVTLSGNGSHSYNNADNCHGKTIAGGQSCSAAVSFAPTSNGAHSASLYIEDNSGNGSQAVSLTGTGIGGTSSGGGCSLLLK